MESNMICSGEVLIYFDFILYW